MKYFLLFGATLCFSALSHAQTSMAAPAQRTMKVSLTKDSLSVTCNNEPVPVNTIHALDSLMKKMPDPKQLQILFESVNAASEKVRAINNVLKQCQCHITKSSKTFREL